MRILIFLLATAALLHAQAGAYNPGTSEGKVETQLTSFKYNDRGVPLKIYLPTAKAAPVILLSHGLGGSREVGAYLGNHWAGRGFVVVAMQHVGSDELIWKDVPKDQRLRAMKKAANSRTIFRNRMGDVPATLDQLEKWSRDTKHFLHGRMNLEKIGMAGHSYGAITTQALCGQNFGPAGTRFADERIDAGLALSPSIPKLGSAKKAFGNIKMPMMLMTGTKDAGLIGSATPETRQQVYPAFPVGSKYELILEDAEHMAFSDRTLTGKEHRNANHHRAIKALSSAYWEAYLADSKPARDWLDGKKPAKLLESGDVWHRK